MALRVIRAGKAVTLLWNLAQTVPPPPVTYDPPSAPTVTIFDANGNTAVSEAPAARVQSGMYSFTFVTPATGPIGIWSAWMDVVDANGVPSGSADITDLTKATPVFQLV